MKLGEGDSSSGSDSAPSDDNLPQAELKKNLPVDSDVAFKKTVKKKNIVKKALESPTKRASSPKTQPKPAQKAAETPLPNIVTPMHTDPTFNVLPLVKKPKPEMRDAETQTDRSDYAILKARMVAR